MVHNFLNARCEVKTMSNDLLLVGVVTQVEPDRLYLGSPNPARDAFLPTLSYGVRVKAVMYKDDLGTRVITGTVYLSGSDLLCIGGVELLASYEKRNFFRVNVEMHTSVNFEQEAESDGLEGLEDIGESQPKMETYSVPVDVLDLSLGGVSFRSDDLPLRVGETMEILLRFENANVPFICSIRRVTREKEGNKSIYGCSFGDVTNKMSTELCAYLFLQQKIQIKKQKEKAFMAGGL